MNLILFETISYDLNSREGPKEPKMGFWAIFCIILYDFVFISSYCIFIRIIIAIMTNNDHMIACIHPASASLEIGYLSELSVMIQLRLILIH